MWVAANLPLGRQKPGWDTQPPPHGHGHDSRETKVAARNERQALLPARRVGVSLPRGSHQRPVSEGPRLWAPRQPAIHRGPAHLRPRPNVQGPPSRCGLSDMRAVRPSRSHVGATCGCSRVTPPPGQHRPCARQPGECWSSPLHTRTARRRELRRLTGGHAAETQQGSSGSRLRRLTRAPSAMPSPRREIAKTRDFRGPTVQATEYSSRAARGLRASEGQRAAWAPGADADRARRRRASTLVRCPALPGGRGRGRRFGAFCRRCVQHEPPLLRGIRKFQQTRQEQAGANGTAQVRARQCRE